MTAGLPIDRTADFGADILANGTDTPARLRLTRNGAAFGSVLNGAELVAVYALAGGDLLVFTHEGVVFEESAHIHWLDGTGVEQGRAHVGMIYATGHLHDLAPAGPRTMTFRFFAKERWRVEARPARGWRRLWSLIGGPPSLHLTVISK